MRSPGPLLGSGGPGSVYSYPEYGAGCPVYRQTEPDEGDRSNDGRPPRLLRQSDPYQTDPGELPPGRDSWCPEETRRWTNSCPTAKRVTPAAS